MCVPDFCSQTVPQSLCPCDGAQIPCTSQQVSSGPSTTLPLTEIANLNAQPNVFPKSTITLQQPHHFLLPSTFNQFIQQQQPQLIHSLNLWQRPVTSQGQLKMQQPAISPPLFIIRTIQQPNQVMQHIPTASHLFVPLQQKHIYLSPSLQQQQHYEWSSQVSLNQPITLQVPGKVTSCFIA
ncbi:unnamed protein product [Thelazia callipaeda]|uniref:AAI domain-containing protein n=1 Tax=Thelazia callipaeda TaxID=103827 RepID=A0A0N5CME6_THECL|nr:unnamed protein product [Thelazia callipaeda]